MKKILLFLLMFFGMSSVYAKDTIESMNIDIYIKNDGTAVVKEIWNTNLSGNKSYTEGYKQYFNLGNSSINNYTVSMDGTAFTTIDDWDIDASFNAKSYKAGIHYTSSGDELCFGISEYGKHSYELNYEVTNFVNNIEGNQLVYWAIVPHEFSFPVDTLYVKIHSDFEYSDELDVWGYGYDGYAYVYDGYIEMSTKKDLAPEEYMVVLIKFPEGTFETNSTIDNDFSYYFTMAEEGASPNGPSKLEQILSTVIPAICSFGFIALMAFFVIKGSSSAKAGTKTFNYTRAPKKLPGDKDINAFRDIPCNKNLYEAYWVGLNYDIVKNKTALLGSLLLKWINENKIEIKSVTSKILKKESKAVVFKDNIEFDHPLERKIYEWMNIASEDGVLEKDEFKKYCNKHYNKVLKWFDEVMDDQTAKLIQTHGVTVDVKTTLGFKNKKYYIEPKMREEAIELKGLKKFLNNFTNVKDKSAIEVKLLGEYLMYAQLFGIADKVAKEFKRLYPDVLTDMNYDDIIFINYISTTGVNAASVAKSRAESYSAGGGGFSSSGGGFGSFGGGGGGGFR
jgi:uncharacterized membrane protein YgcG